MKGMMITIPGPRRPIMRPSRNRTMRWYSRTTLIDDHKITRNSSTITAATINTPVTASPPRGRRRLRLARRPALRICDLVHFEGQSPAPDHLHRRAHRDRRGIVACHDRAPLLAPESHHPARCELAHHDRVLADVWAMGPDR